MERAKHEPLPEPPADMHALAEDMLDEFQCSMGWNFWKREELEAFCRKAVDLAELVLERRGKE